jgi:hypothetical protein
MSRYNDISMRTMALTEPFQLPAINWGLVGQSAPTLVPVNYGGPGGKLPNADAIVMTWTSAEWAAMDHVFIRSGQAETPSTAMPKVSSWYLYSRGVSAPGSGNTPLWGYYQLVRINSEGGGHTILLFKSDAHLAHAPYLSGLTKELQELIQDVSPRRLYSIGTAGAATDKQNLGDVAITNCAHCQLTLKENLADDGKTVTCASFFPNTTNLLPNVQAKLFFKLSSVATTAEWQRVLTQVQNDPQDRSLVPYSLADLMNGPIEPANLSAPKAVDFKGTPLLTTDDYYIAPGNTPQYAALEMDDGVVGLVAQRMKIPFAFIRNISDTVIVTQDKSGKAIPPDARKAWSSVQYDHFGVYSSFNGALAAWATLADW